MLLYKLKSTGNKLLHKLKSTRNILALVLVTGCRDLHVPLMMEAEQTFFF